MTELEYQERKLIDLQKMASNVFDEIHDIMSWGYSESNKEKVDRLDIIYNFLTKETRSVSFQVEWLKTQK